jgi:hypothetical protein
MQVQTRVKNCTHIKVTGVRCGSAALRGEQFCAAHRQSPGLAPPLSPARKRGSHPGRPHRGRQWPDRGTIELRRGELILCALNTAVRNIRRVKFDLHAEKDGERSSPRPRPARAKTNSRTSPRVDSQRGSSRHGSRRETSSCEDSRKSAPLRRIVWGRTHSSVRRPRSTGPQRSCTLPDSQITRSTAGRSRIAHHRSDPPQTATKCERSSSSEGAKDCSPLRKRRVNSPKENKPRRGERKFHEDGSFRMTKSKIPTLPQKAREGWAPSIVKLQSEVENP